MSDSESAKPSGPVFVNPNKKYGLTIPSKQKAQIIKPKAIVKPCIFDEEEESDSEEAKPNKPTHQQVNTSTSLLKKQTQIQIEKAMQENQNIFEYDEIYDELEKEKNKIDPKAKKNESKEPKYIVGIMKAAAKRKMEFERVQERKIQKEREQEGDLWADKEVFVTTAYRKKMEERQKIEEEERRQEQIENLLDVRKQKDLSGFYFSMLKMRTGEFVIEEEAEKEKKLEQERQEAVKFKETKSSQKAFRPKKDEESEEEPENVDEKFVEAKQEPTQVDQETAIVQSQPEEFKEPEAKKPKEAVEEIKTEVKQEPQLSKEERRRLRLEQLFNKRTIGENFDKELSEYFQRKAILDQKTYIERE